MRILMVFPYAPLPPPRDLGGTKRNLPFFRENLKRHEVSVLSYGTAEEERIFREAFGPLCARIRFVDATRPRIINGLEKFWLLMTGRSPFRQTYRSIMQSAIDTLSREATFDVIHCCTQMLGCFRFPRGIPVVSDTHEVTYDLFWRMSRMTRNPFRKAFAYAMYKLGKPEEISLCESFDAIIATTARDRDVFRQVLPDQRIFEINNGVDHAFFEDLHLEPEPGAIVFTGKMSYYPNLHGILYFLDDIFPLVVRERKNARIYIVGTEPPRALLARSASNIVVTGFVEDVRPYVARSQVFVIPLKIGGGIRGKALEAMAMRKAIVTTSIGCESIGLSHERSALIADTAESFAHEVIRILTDRPLAERISMNAQERVAEHYQWEMKGRELDEVYRTVAARPKDRLEDAQQHIPRLAL